MKKKELEEIAKKVKQKSLDDRVYSAIVLMENSGIRISIRKIANAINKENSLRSIQLSFERIIQKWFLYRDKEGLIRVTGNIRTNKNDMKNREK